MEGLIPYLYKAIVQHKEDHHHSATDSWLCGSSSPSAPYVRLCSGDSGRFQLVSSDNSHVNNNNTSIIKSGSSNQVIMPNEVRSPSQYLVPRHGHGINSQAILMH
ncbi:Metal transporter Nramp1 [Bienertia sinuspersici]